MRATTPWLSFLKKFPTSKALCGLMRRETILFFFCCEKYCHRISKAYGCLWVDLNMKHFEIRWIGQFCRLRWRVGWRLRSSFLGCLRWQESLDQTWRPREEKRRPPHGVFKGARNSLHPGLRRKASLIDQESIVSAWYHLTTEALMFWYERFSPFFQHVDFNTLFLHALLRYFYQRCADVAAEVCLGPESFFAMV